MKSTLFDSIEVGLADLQAGKMLLVADAANRENEVDLVLAAENATAEQLAFMIKYTSGFICVPMSEENADRLNLPPMYQINQDKHNTSYAVTVDAAERNGTGISAADRAYTINLLASQTSTAQDFTRPGHVVPLRANSLGVLGREGHTEATLDLLKIAGKTPVGVIGEMVSIADPTTMAQPEEMRKFADKHGLHMISVQELVLYRKQTEELVFETARANLPTKYGDFSIIAFDDVVGKPTNLALVRGVSDDLRGKENVLVRMHSECLTGDVFGSLRCDCGPQLEKSLQTLAEVDTGLLLYLRGQEGRGIGIANKIKAYAFQEQGLDTYDANLKLGFLPDERDYVYAAQIIKKLGIKSIKLLTNNPDKITALRTYGVTITEQVHTNVGINSLNKEYIHTKIVRMGHEFKEIDSE